MSWSFYDANGKILQGILGGAVDTTGLADDAVTYAKLQNLATADRVLGSESTGVIGEVQIVPDMIASDAVTTVKILDANVTLAKLATDTYASITNRGIVELAIGTEVTTGTSATLAVTPDGLAGSVRFGTRYIQCVVFDSGTDIAEGNGKFFFHVPAGLDTMDLVEAHARVATVGSGSTVDIDFFLNHSTTNASTGNDMLDAHLTIDDGELDSSNAATAVTFEGSYKQVNTNDMIRIDVDGNGGDSTIAKGLIVTMGFRLP